MSRSADPPANMAPVRLRRSAIWEPMLAGALPGLLGGAHLAGLLFFLNPHLPFTLAVAFRSVAYYGLGLSLLSLVLHLPYTWRSRRRARRLLPWTVTLVLAATGVGAFLHASRFAFFLPPGMNRRLVKLGVLVLASAVICFYTALLHSMKRRPYGIGSRLLFGSLIIATAYAAFERREAFNPRLPESPRATIVEPSQRPTLAVVGIDTATLDAILPLAEMGRLPFFAQLRANGSFARLQSIRPTDRTALWSTLASGTLPYRHGNVGTRRYRAPFTNGDFRLLPLGIGFALWGTLGVDEGSLHLSETHRLTLPRILGRLGLRVAAVGWPGESEPNKDLAVWIPESLFTHGDGSHVEVVPEDLEGRAMLFRPGLDDIDVDLLARFGEDVPGSILGSLRADLWRTGLCRFLLDQRPRIDALFTVLPGLESVSHQHFGGHDAVHFRGGQGDRATRSAQLIAAYYESLDRALAELWALMPEPRLLIVVSAYGVEAASWGRRAFDRLTGNPTLEGRSSRGPDGIFMMLGEGARKDMINGQVTLADVAPTILYGLGFPVANDIDGVVLTRAFDAGFLARRALSFVPSYETLAAP